MVTVSLLFVFPSVSSPTFLRQAQPGEILFSFTNSSFNFLMQHGINCVIMKFHSSQIYYMDKEKRRSCFLVFNHFSTVGLAHLKVTLPNVKNTCFNWRNSFDGSHQEIKTTQGAYCLKPYMQISQLVNNVQQRNQYSVLE